MEQQVPTEAYPLTWPAGRPRTKRTERSRFGVKFSTARNQIVNSIRLLGGKAMILSTNIPTKRDGLPYAIQTQPDDTGVAVYFTYKGKQMCFACDRWNKVEDNLRAVALTIEGLRGIARWGTGDMMEAAFTGFTALPNPDRTISWMEVLGFAAGSVVTLDDAESAYKRLRSAHHPDKGGSADQFNAVQQAYEQARKHFESM